MKRKLNTNKFLQIQPSVFLSILNPRKITLLSILVLSFGLHSVYAETASANKTKEQNEKTTSVSGFTEPHRLIADVTDTLIKIVNTHQDAIKNNNNAVYEKVQGVMERVVDFDYIAKNVMGANYWNIATENQRQRFTQVFTSGLVQTYTKGMANFSKMEISVLPTSENLEGKNKVTVTQQFKGPSGTKLVAYSMGRKKTGEWKLINVVLDGVNLGETLRTQFAQSVSENKGNLDVTIDSWQLGS